MIKINHLTKTYKNDTRALHDLNLTIGEGMFGLVGPNGAGKTTLMRILAGIITPSEGSVSIFGHDMATRAGKNAVRQVLGYLPQNPGLYPDLTGREFLDYVAIIKGIRSRQQRQAQVENLLEEIRLGDVADNRLRTYSGGMKQRIGIAQALLGNPRLLIVDEPTVGLDPEERVRFRNLLSRMATRCTVILSTHIIEDINQSCRDLAVLNHGQVLFQGAPTDLIEQAQGHVWTILMQDELPDVTVVSTLQYHDGVQYRILGTPPAGYEAMPVSPTLEDGYMWLMQREGRGVAV